MPLKAIIFDVDGTLAETEEVHRRAFNDTFIDMGMGWNWDDTLYTQLLKTTGGKERMKAYAESIGQYVAPKMLAELHQRKTRAYTAMVAHRDITLRPGIRQLITDARDRGLKLAIATTTNRPNVDALIEATFDCPAAELFAVIVAGDEVPKKKPAPDVYLKALDALGLPAARCVALEDSRNGLHAATAAGIRTIVSPSRYTLGEDFTGAAAVIQSFTEIDSVSTLQRRLSSAAAKAAPGNH